MGIPPEQIERFLAESRARIDRYLDAFLPPETEIPGRLHEAMRYAVLSGGKRLRPALAFGSALACCVDPEAVLPVAGAVEFVHAYSLVHDDLPQMDDDSERRGRPTVHVAYDESTAILVGDALLAEAFRCLATGGVPVRVVRHLAEAAGSRALVGGQVEDLAWAEGSSEEQLERIHERKTAALFSFAVVGAAVVAGASSELESRLGRYARHYGLAFQLTDDCLDAGTKECSALALLPEAQVRQRIDRHVAAALGALEPLGDGADPLRGLGEQLAGRLR
jgi:geranylgeranyl pyrophosphate synthase